MQISEVRVKLISNPTDRLKAFCSITLDGDFVIRDIKLIEGGTGIFVAMPSRKLADHCPKCRAKNHLRARHCNECGAALGADRVQRDKAGRRKIHADIAHPINSTCRQHLQERIVEAFEQELAASRQPGYKPAELDEDDDYATDTDDAQPVARSESAGQPTSVDDDESDIESPDADPSADDGGGDYQDMIADLKRDAAERRAAYDGRRTHVFDDAPDRADPSPNTDVEDEGQDAFEDEVHDEVEDRDALEDDHSAAFGVGLHDGPSEERAPLTPSAVDVSHPGREPDDEDDDFGAGIQ